MGILQIAAVTLAVAGSALAAPTAAAAKYCDAASTLCYQEWKSPNNIIYRVAIPPVTAAPFDVALQIVAPRATGWAGIAWGGGMLNNPLTVAWVNGTNVTVTSRQATAYSAPAVYAGPTFTYLPGTAVNTTHWTLDVVVKGVSQWTAKGQTAALNPASAAYGLAWGFSATAPQRPADAASPFGAHQQKGKFTLDLAGAKADNFATATKPKTP